MCGITCIYSKDEKVSEDDLIRMLDKIKHRGYSKFEIKDFRYCVLGTNRLEIVDRTHGIQPVVNEDGDVAVIMNGEIYNHEFLRKKLIVKGHCFKTECDTEILVHLWEEYKEKLIKKLDGMYAFIIYDSRSKTIFAGRDHFGIKPLYFLKYKDKYYFSSEIKSLTFFNLSTLREIPPSCYFLNGKIKPYYKVLNPCSSTFSNIYSVEAYKNKIRDLLINSVKKRVKTDLPLAVFFSGGIDSCIILKLATKFHPNVTAITVGLKDSPDLSTAKRFCSENNIRHITQEIDKNDIKNEFVKILNYLESFEPNLVRGGIFTYFMSKVAKNNGFRIALSGEGSDEIFAGYKDFFYLKDKEINWNCLKLLKDLYRTQLFRLDRCTMANTVETRVPFMDKYLVRAALSIPPNLKVFRNNGYSTNKFILREAFKDILPDYIYERPKIPMDEGAVQGGKTGLNCLIKSILKDINGKFNNYDQGSIFGNIKFNSFEEKFYFHKFKELGYDNPISAKKIYVRKF